MTHERTVCLLAFSVIRDDPRVRRSGDAFHANGWSVVGVGLPGGRSASPPWQIFETQNVSLHGSPSSPTARLLGVAGQHDSTVAPFLETLKADQLFRRGISAARYLWGGTHPKRALELYWSWPSVNALYNIARKVQANVWIANDWITLPLAARLADEQGGIVGYDSHEFAIHEYEERFGWRMFNRPVIAALEKQFINRAEVITTVSDGIASNLRSLYRLNELPTTVLSVPPYHATKFRSTGDTIRVLYHGAIAPGRGLEQGINSAILWNKQMTLTLRGPGDSNYIASLKRQIETLKVQKQVSIVPPVPMTELVSEATSFDIGFLALPAHSRHNAFALPNKIFEYIMAGLALCISDLPEMGQLVRKHELGVLISEASPKSIADAINRLDQTIIDKFKRNALTVAPTLAWEKVQEKLLASYDRAVSQVEAAAPVDS